MHGAEKVNTNIKVCNKKQILHFHDKVKRILSKN